MTADHAPGLSAEERLREFAQAATPGPWECDETSGVNDLHFGHVATPVLRPMGYYGPRLHDARFMAEADPPTVLALLDGLDAARARLGEVAALADDWATRTDAVCCDSCQERVDYGRLLADDLRAILDGAARDGAT